MAWDGNGDKVVSQTVFLCRKCAESRPVGRTSYVGAGVTAANDGGRPGRTVPDSTGWQVAGNGTGT